MNFDKNNTSSFEFDVSMLDELPKPTFTPPPPQRIVEEFTTAGTHTYTFNEGVPATIEIYALGAGGGGQGGHRSDAITGWKGSGTGASGGGGAAAWMKFEHEENLEFTITVGKGGTGGNGTDRIIGQTWQSGSAGGAGGESKVEFGSTTLTVNGGRGGGGSGTNLVGGPGGAISPKPGNILDSNWNTQPGNVGYEGIKDGDNRNTNRGGDAASILPDFDSTSSGAISGTSAGPGGGGNGGYNYNGKGADGGDGRVVIIITY